MITITERDGNTIYAELTVAHHVVRVVTRVALLHDRLLLYDFHVDGPGRGTVGVAALRHAVDELMETFGVGVVEIRGFRRTTGAGPGRVPKPLVFRRRARG